MVHVRVTAAPGAQSADLTRLYDWFRDTREVACDTEITLSAGSARGAMGTGEVINMVVGHALTLTSIAIAYAGYRRGSPSSPPATFQLNSGRVLVLPADPVAAAELLRDAVENPADLDAGS
jgi:Effector Associated Constant Component 1